MTHISSDTTLLSEASAQLDSPSEIDAATLGAESQAEPERLIYRHLRSSHGRGQESTPNGIAS